MRAQTRNVDIMFFGIPHTPKQLTIVRCFYTWTINASGWCLVYRTISNIYL